MRIDERVLVGLEATTRFGDVRFLDDVDSTNRYVSDAALAGAPEGLVVVAEHQQAGRGRLGRSWEAPPGSALLVSILLRPDQLGPERLHLVTAAVGLSAKAAVRRVAAVDADLKWPNDLLVGDRKLAGILAEALEVTPSGKVGAVVVGVGLNVSSSPPYAISVEAAAGRSVSRPDLLVALLEELDWRYGHWDALAEEYRTSCATVGRRVRVEGPAGSVRIGVARRIDADGRLVLADEATGADVAISVGDVVHLRPGAATGG